MVKHPEIYGKLLAEGHATGNHTHNHVNGWKTANSQYIENVQAAAEHVNSKLFRPPYGRISKLQAKMLQENPDFNFSVVMWNVLSGDFDTALSPEGCLKNVLENAKPGSIIVFHDSEKAYERMSYALPRLLEYYSNQGYTFRPITLKKEG